MEDAPTERWNCGRDRRNSSLESCRTNSMRPPAQKRCHGLDRRYTQAGSTSSLRICPTTVGDSVGSPVGGR